MEPTCRVGGSVSHPSFPWATVPTRPGKKEKKQREEVKGKRQKKKEKKEKEDGRRKNEREDGEKETLAAETGGGFKFCPVLLEPAYWDRRILQHPGRCQRSNPPIHIHLQNSQAHSLAFTRIHSSPHSHSHPHAFALIGIHMSRVHGVSQNATRSCLV